MGEDPTGNRGESNQGGKNPGVSRRRALKTMPVAATAPGLLGQGAAAEELNSKEPPEDGAGAARVQSLDVNLQQAVDASARNFLIVKDCDAWYAPANEWVLGALGYSYDVISSGDFGGHDLSGYTDVVLPSTQTGSYYSRLDANSDKLEAFVSDGGTLHAHVATSGYPCTTYGTPSFLPGDVDTAVDYHNNLTITASNNPVVEGIGNLDNWGYSTHGFLTNVPGSATVIAGFAGDPNGRPTFVEYSHGDGAVLATTQTIEWPFYSGGGTGQLLINELQYRGGATGGGGIDDLVDEKRGLIDSIRDHAGATIGRDEADILVDNEAEFLVDDIENDEFDVDDDQYREALERMIAAEEATETSTDTVTGNDNPMRRNLENLYSLLTGAAIELLSAAAGGIIKRVVNSIVRGIARKFDDLVRGLNGRGIISESTMESVQGTLNGITTQSYYTFKSFNENHPDVADDVVSTAGSESLSAAQGAAEGILDELNDGRSLMDIVEELYFEGYYFEPDWPVINIPSPDEIEVPDLQFSYDVPDEELPNWAQGAVPDEINFDYDTPDIDLPDGIDDVTNVLEEIQEVASSGGIDTSIDDRMDSLEDDLGSLSEQDDATRSAVTNGLTTGISGFSLVTDALIDLLEGLQDLLSGISDFLSYLSIAAVVAGLALIATGVGTLGLLGAAGTLATVSGALGIIALAVDGVQIAVGQNYLSSLTTIHHGGTYALTRTDLGGVDL
ncbi:hypothetical protein BRC81_01670 [Halobacteriales archaeon QS_1_68_20]|nr:MAG: hypothetical protein BRC81_01670 [Halobacteriales archaeon QS_1_68_20]